jgi:hypothetical protein
MIEPLTKALRRVTRRPEPSAASEPPPADAAPASEPQKDVRSMHTPGGELSPADVDASRYAASVLADYAAVSDRARAADRERRRLRKTVDALPVGIHGGWEKRLGEPGEVLDADRVRELLAERGLAVPMKPAAPPLEVVFVGVDGEHGGR